MCKLLPIVESNKQNNILFISNVIEMMKSGIKTMLYGVRCALKAKLSWRRFPVPWNQTVGAALFFTKNTVARWFIYEHLAVLEVIYRQSAGRQIIDGGNLRELEDSCHKYIDKFFH